MWIAMVASLASLALIVAAYVRARRFEEYLTTYGWPHQALCVAASLCAAAAAAAHATTGRPWYAAGSTALALLAAATAARARQRARTIVRDKQATAHRLLKSHRAYRVDVPVTETARLRMDTRGGLQVCYPAVWPPSPLTRVIARARRPAARRRTGPPPGPRRGGPAR